MIQMLRDARKSQRKNIAQRRTEVKADALGSFKSPEDINQFLKSDFVASVEDEIRKASNINLTMELCISVQDYVIFGNLIANGQRAEAVLSKTLIGLLFENIKLRTVIYFL